MIRMLSICFQRRAVLSGIKSKLFAFKLWLPRAFSAQDRRRVKEVVPGLNPKLSLQELLCEGATDCDGGWSSTALNYAWDFGVFSADCWPYAGNENDCNK